MNILKRNWWKILLAVLAALLARLLLLQLLPFRSGSSFEMAPSVISQSLGMIPTAGIVVTIAYSIIASVLTIVQEQLPGSALTRVLRCGLSFGLMWLLAVLETVPSLGKPFLAELWTGLSDIVPILLLGGIIGWRASPRSRREAQPANFSAVSGMLTVAFAYFVGRYLQYAVIRVNSGYFTNEISTFLWTLVMGLTVGLAYFLLRDGVRGNRPLSRAVWYGGVVFGLYWAVNNFFMPILFDMSFLAFTPVIMNYVYRVAVDIVFVILGVWIFERSASDLPIQQ